MFGWRNSSHDGVNRLVISGNIELTEVNIGFKSGRGFDSNTASLVSSYAAGVIAAFSKDYSPPQTGDVTPRTRIWFNPDLRSRTYFVPGGLSQQFFQGHRCSGEVEVHRRVLALEVNGLEHRSNIPIMAGGLCQRHDRAEFFLKLPAGI
jgi:hypothetical protein